VTSSKTGHPTRATRVTFFEDRAEVTRKAKLQLSAGKSWVRLEGVTPFVDDRSVRATPQDGEVTLLGVRVRRSLDEVRRGDPQEVLEASARAESLRLASSARESDCKEATRALQRLRELQAAWSRGLAKVPAGLGEDPQPWRESYSEVAAAALSAVESLRAADVKREESLQEVQDASETLAFLSGLRTRWEAAIEVQLEAPRDLELEVEVTYRTPCALWRPEHLVRLERDSDEAPDGNLVVTTFATAWQATGEDWSEVEAEFSTARPGRAAQAPLGEDDTLRTREKTSQERREVVVAARDEAVNLAGLGRGKRQADEMPGVDDGGEPLTIKAAEAVSLPSTGRPFRVPTGTRTLPAGLVRIALPEVAPVAHLRATATLSEGLPLLAGPVRLARGEGRREHLVGRSKLEFVSPGDPFELGFGADEAVRVRRETESESDTGWTGGQKRTRKVTLYLSNLSTDVKRVLVKERVPVSEIDEVEVSIAAAGWEHDAPDGFLTRMVELSPRGSEELGFSYTIQAGRKVVLPHDL
jgi:uncharacterized protein (TIGR02231 family)